MLKKLVSLAGQKRMLGGTEIEAWQDRNGKLQDQNEKLDNFLTPLVGFCQIFQFFFHFCPFFSHLSVIFDHLKNSLGKQLGKAAWEKRIGELAPPLMLHFIYQPFRNSFSNSVYVNSNRICCTCTYSTKVNSRTQIMKSLLNFKGQIFKTNSKQYINYIPPPGRSGLGNITCSVKTTWILDTLIFLGLHSSYYNVILHKSAK